MKPFVRFLKAFGAFWYEFIIGDDWKIAAAVVLAMVATWGLLLTGLDERLVTACGCALLLACFTGALLVDRRS